MPDEQFDPFEIYKSIFGHADAFVYRCHNDKEYTMQYMSGRVQDVCGRPADDIIDNAKVSFVGLTHPDDKDQVFAAVDDAIEKKAGWNVLYRLVRPDGSDSWIRERGSAVFDERGEVIFLQGLIVEAQSEIALRDKINAMANHTKEANQDILGLTQKILRTEKHLSILSINAGIEAARAGEAGRGFAVIAQEIKARVDENGKWAEEIAGKMVH